MFSRFDRLHSWKILSYERCVTVNLLCSNVNNTITNAPLINYFPKTDTFLKRYIDNGSIYVKKLDINAERVTFETSFRAYFGCFWLFLTVSALFSKEQKPRKTKKVARSFASRLRNILRKSISFRERSNVTLIRCRS